MRILKQLLFFLIAMGTVHLVSAHRPGIDGGVVNPNEGQNETVSFRADCAEATAQVDMDINNVRARLLNGGDLWWDLSDGRYVIPNVEDDQNPRSSIFAGAVWLGGVDEGNNLKLAAQTYRQSGNDFWPGPLTPDQGLINPDTCNNWDRFYEVLGSNIDIHIRNFEASCDENGVNCEYDCDDIPIDVKGWPGRGNPFFEEIHGFELPDTKQGLAGYFDQDGDGIYNPCNGDFPVIEVRGCEAEINYPDQMYFWIYNDAGGTHGQSGGDQIRMEVQVQSFAYAGSDELNDMSFYRYKLINRAIEPIDSTFFAMWVDPDLGCANDDYIGCDTSRSLGIVYNSDDFDEDCLGANGYGGEVPVLGVDYFRGPLGPESKEIVINGDTIIRDTLVELGMSSFTYYNRGDISPTPAEADPSNAIEYYRYLTGHWRDGLPFTFGGRGYNPASTDIINYAFTESPDLPLPAWSMCSEDLTPSDRRTIQASGPFRLDPGAVNELIIGVVWTADMDYPCPDISRLLDADDIAQNIFDNCFDVPDGPDAPDLDFIELDQQLVAVISNAPSSNNFMEQYTEVDINAPDNVSDSLYRFEGYIIYQLANSNVGIADLGDLSKARPIIQVDKKNGVADLYNWEEAQGPEGIEAINVPVQQVEGSDGGIQHTFLIREDQFASGADNRLVNHRKYYFTAIAYAYNEYEPFDFRTIPPTGQSTPFLSGRKNVRIYSPLPRPILDRRLQSNYGDEPQITRLAGQGNPGKFLRVVNGTDDRVLSLDFDSTVTYLSGFGPLNVKVYNPLDVLDGSYTLSFIDEDMDEDLDDVELNDTVSWYLIDPVGDTIFSENTIESLNEKIIADYGFSISIEQTPEPGTEESANNGAIGVELEYADIEGPGWFLGAEDAPLGIFNFMKTGSNETDTEFDPTQVYSQLDDGWWFPYFLMDWEEGGVGEFYDYVSSGWQNERNEVVRNQTDLTQLNNVNVVFTSDKSKWTRCVIIETASQAYTDDNNGLGIPPQENEDIDCGSGDVDEFTVRAAPSVGKFDEDGDGLPDPDGAVDEDGNPLVGFGWFPGYAYDVETGQRLNIFFGENSTYSLEVDDFLKDIYGIGPEDFIGLNETMDTFVNIPPVGRDMMFNPTFQQTLDVNDDGVAGNDFPYDYYLGGQHYIYVTNQPYDSCMEIYSRIECGSSGLKKVNAVKTVTWTAMPFMAPATSMLSYQDGLIPNDLTVRLRVNNKYETALGVGEYRGYPSYEFTFDGVEANFSDTEEEFARELDFINVVPNPYYGSSFYEANEFATTIKITNLPARCIVTIYSLDGRFIRQYNRNEIPDETFDGVPNGQYAPALEWDLRNAANIPVASGIYLIHIDAFEKGEKVIKWFGVGRQFDPTGL